MKLVTLLPLEVHMKMAVALSFACSCSIHTHIRIYESVYIYTLINNVMVQ